MSNGVRHKGWRKGVGRLAMLLAVLLLGLVALWVAGVLAFVVSPREWGAGVAATFLVGLLALAIHRRSRSVVPWLVGGSALVAAGIFLSRTPSNERDWEPREARLAWGEVDGHTLTVHNVRNFRYRTLDDYDAAWEVRRYDLRGLRAISFVLARFPDLPWGAHTFVSFGFEGGEHLAISIEARKEKGESYGVIAGLFRSFETIYVAGDERDLVGLRTHVQRDAVHLYPMRSTAAGRRAFLLDMVRRMNELREEPSFYNTLVDTCTTGLHEHLERVRAEATPLAYEVLVSGLSDRRAYDLGLIDTDLEFAEARARSRIDPGVTTPHADDFSEAIRRGW